MVLTGAIGGQEFQANIPLNLISDSLDGAGIQFSATFLDGYLDDGARSSIPGTSDESYSLLAYYENSGWEFRIAGTKRDEFPTEARGLSLSLVPAE